MSISAPSFKVSAGIRPCTNDYFNKAHSNSVWPALLALLRASAVSVAIQEWYVWVYQRDYLTCLQLYYPLLHSSLDRRSLLWLKMLPSVKKLAVLITMPAANKNSLVLVTKLKMKLMVS